MPELGHATYVFAKPSDIDAFVQMYAKTKEDIRKNRDSVAERLGFLGRVTHGASYRTWLRDLNSRVGETANYALVLE